MTSPQQPISGVGTKKPIFVFINVREKKYARYEGKDQKEIFFADKLIEDPYWIEMLRTSPADAIAPDEANLDAHITGL